MSKKKSLTATDMWKMFEKNYPELAETINYKIYKEVLARANKKLVKELIEGKKVYLGHRLGNLYVRKKKRNMKKKAIDWNATYTMWKEKGERKGLIYYTSDYFFLFHWDDKHCDIPNRTVYRFKAARNNKDKNGPANLLAKRLQEDPFAHLNYMT